MATPDLKSTVGIIGFGRFGPVLARLLTPGFEVLAYDIVDITERAKSVGARAVEWNEIAAASTIFMAVPIRNLKSVAAKLAPAVQPGSTVFDVCSVKVYPATILKEFFSPEVSTIASHPLFGPDSSKKGFANLPMVMHPVSPRTAMFDNWLDYFQQQGLSVSIITPEEHDHLAARSQGITHFIGRVLTEFGIESTLIDTEGFRDLHLVVDQTCHDSFELFQDLEHFNPYTMQMIDDLTQAIEKTKQSILRRE